MSHHRGHQGRIFWGLLLVILGFLFLFDQMGRLDFGDIISTYWPVIFIIIGLSILWSNSFRHAGPGLFFIIFGVFFLLAELDVLRYSVWHYIWPTLIIIAGIWLLIKPTFRPPSREKFSDIKENDLNITAIFSGMKQRVESQKFRGGKATALFGAVEIDLTQATLDENKATIDLTAFCGGIEIKVPREWKVVLDGTPLLGAIEDKHRGVPESEAKATLSIRGTAILGGIEIKD
ncbi:MAG: DUF5668 domain-containing protein [Candidatus Aminicenantales bacterium]